jgi:phosphoglycolate phosphatase
VLAIHALETAVDRTISGDSLSTKKPDPAGVLACLDEFSVPPERALFVGDSSIDAATARNAGIAAWLLPHGYNMGEPVETAGADRVIPDFAELQARVLGTSGPVAGSERPKPLANLGAR